MRLPLFRLLLLALTTSTLTLAAWCLRPQLGVPPMAEALAVAVPYLDAYARFDLEALRPFLDEESTWCDPTSAELGEGGKPVHGAEAILAELRRSTTNVQDLRFEFDETFASGGHVVAIGTLLYTLPPEALGRTERPAHFALRVVVVLKIVGKTVRSHTDYSDFSHWQEAAR